MAERGEPLSDRELAVLNRLAAGESNKAIADGLSISPYTVKTHLRNIYTKLDVSTRTEAMTVALQRGILADTRYYEMGDGSTVGEQGSRGEREKGSEGGGEIEPLLIAPMMDAGYEIEETSEQGKLGVSHRWRNLSVGLLGVLGVAVVVWLLAQWRGGGLFTAAVEPFVEQALGETRWLSSRPAPEARAGRAVVALGLDIYVLGGETAEGVTDEARVFNTQAREWRQVTSKPTPVGGATAAELFGEIYVPGGLADDGQPTAAVEAYSPAQNAWRRVASLPGPVADGLAVADGGFLYLFGGRDEDGPLDTAFVYDPGADSWRPIAPLPGARAGPAGGALTGKLYVVGGMDETGPSESCFVYDPAADAWDDCPAMLLPRAGAGATVLLNKLYVIGGTENAAADYGEVYDPNSGTWTVLNAPPDVGAWSEPGVAHVETRIYALGGRKGETLSDATLIYAPLAFQTFIPAAPSDAEE